MVTLDDVKAVLREDVCVDGIEKMSDEQILRAKFCYELKMDSLDFQDFVSHMEKKIGKPIPSEGAENSTVKNFIDRCNL